MLKARTPQQLRTENGAGRFVPAELYPCSGTCRFHAAGLLAAWHHPSAPPGWFLLGVGKKRPGSYVHWTAAAPCPCSLPPSPCPQLPPTPCAPPPAPCMLPVLLLLSAPSPCPAPPRPCRALCRYVGTDGVYTLTTPYERDDKCPICSAGVSHEVAPSTTLQQVWCVCGVHSGDGACAHVRGRKGQVLRGCLVGYDLPP